VISLDRIRQFKQFLLGGLGRRERAVSLEFHLGCMIAVPMASAWRFAPLGPLGIILTESEPNDSFCLCDRQSWSFDLEWFNANWTDGVHGCVGSIMVGGERPRH
jgi:hypothetical protein